MVPGIAQLAQIEIHHLTAGIKEINYKENTKYQPEKQEETKQEGVESSALWCRGLAGPDLNVPIVFSNMNITGDISKAFTTFFLGLSRAEYMCLSTLFTLYKDDTGGSMLQDSQ